MKQAKKRALGCLGLLGVVAMTCVAILMPSQEASAATSVTDTLEVRVVGTTPYVRISGIQDDAVYVNPERPFVVSYENVAGLTMSLEYTDVQGNKTSQVLDQIDASDTYGEIYYEINFVE